MKMKLATLALCACSISFLPARTAESEKPTPEKAEEEVKPEGPLEERAFAIFDLTSALPDIFASVTDAASIAAAQVKLDTLSTKLTAHAAELKKMDAPTNEARKKLKAKIDPKQKAINQKMQGAMKAMMELDEQTAMQVGTMFMGFGQTMQELTPVMTKYFSPDPEEGGEDK
ncbi:MAG: type I site-specific restriction endonuclease [Akkermansiaceae bacterium]|jgi:type I site-specific restriction endonuclease